MMTREELKTATVDQLQEELAAAGLESTSKDIDYLRESVANLLDETEALNR